MPHTLTFQELVDACIASNSHHAPSNPRTPAEDDSDEVASSTLDLLSRANRADLSRRELVGLDHFELCSSLTELYLASNALVDLSPLAVLAPTLRVLDIAHNAMTSLADLACLHSLMVLDASHNTLAPVSDPRALTALLPPRLVSLDLRGNPLLLTRPVAAAVEAALPRLVELNGVAVVDDEDEDDEEDERSNDGGRNGGQAMIATPPAPVLALESLAVNDVLDAIDIAAAAARVRAADAIWEARTASASRRRGIAEQAAAYDDNTADPEPVDNSTPTPSSP